MTKKKIMMAAMSAGLVAVVGVGGTLAYLSAQSDVVNNTFTIGTGYITDDDDHTGIFIDETDVDNSNGGARDTDNEYKEMVPAKSYTKDPLVHMVGGTIESYVFVKVEGLADLDAQNIHVWYEDEEGNLQQGVDLSDYTLITSYNDKGDGIYLYTGGKYAVPGAEYVVDVSDETEKSNCPLDNVFDIVKMDEDVSSDTFEQITLDGKAITVQAAAVQYAEGMDSYEDAYATLPTEWMHS